MPTTANFGFPYPSLTDAPNGPSEIQSLATSVDAALATRTAILIQYGTVPVTPVTGVYTQVAVTFPVAFSGTPNVQVTPIAVGPGTISSAGSDSPTTTGCNVGCIRTNTTVTTLQWIAVGPR